MAEETGYWLKRRLGRRAVLRAGAAGSSVLVLGLAACSSNKNNSSSSKPAGNTAGNTGPSRGLITESTGTPAAASAQGKPGGSFSFQVSSPPPTLDPYTQTSYLNSYMNGMTYSLLYSFKAGQPGVAPGDSTMEPDLATALPEQPDKTTFTIKLRPAKFHNVPPTNGRALTSEDVRYAIDRYQNYEKSVHKSFWNWLDSIQTPDPQTIQLKAKFPYADAVQIMGNNLGAYISPKEFAETPDAATKMVGSGPYIHTEYQTGVSLSWKKNPDYYLKPMPYFDEVKAFIVTDTAKRVADFSAKSVNYSWLFLPDERDQLKKNRPDAKFAETQGISGYIYMRTDKPPFNDKRVRQALSMAIDRKAIRDAISKGEGIDDQALFVGNAGWARQVKDLGDSAKYWTHDVQAAKQLLQAAGVGNLDFTWSHADAAVYTQAYVDTSTLTQAQWKDIGVTVKDNQQPYGPVHQHHLPGQLRWRRPQPARGAGVPGRAQRPVLLGQGRQPCPHQPELRKRPDAERPARQAARRIRRALA
jgi:peptide/nickel transport system substrate-binding protein